MKNLTISGITLILYLTLPAEILAGNGYGGGPASVQQSLLGPSSAITVDTSIVLSATEEMNLAFMREEEKLARDVYISLFNLWGSNIFTNISRSEQTHMDSVKFILDAYNLSDPAPVDQGFFTAPELQNLYDQLIIKGNISLIEALQVGALIEEVDIRDLYRTINETRNPAILLMYTQLLNGSYRHLNAFTGQLRMLGVTYVPQVLSAAEVASILAGEVFNVELVDGLAIDSENKTIPTQSRFSHTLSSVAGITGNYSTISTSDPVALSTHIIPGAEDLGKSAEYLVVLQYQSASGQRSLYARSGEQWQAWNGNPANLESAMQQTLKEVQIFNIFQGQLINLPGEFTFYTGYRLPDGKIVFSAEPMTVLVK